MSRYAFALAVALTSCGGPPFVMANAPDDAGDDASPIVATLAELHDGSLDALDASTAPSIDSGPDSARSPDGAALPDAPAMPEAAPVPTCTPFSANVLESCPSACGGSCGNPTTVPSVFYRMSPTNYSGCGPVQTPTPCSACREDFTCACVVAHWTVTVDVCGSTTIVATCDDSSGIPVVTCGS